MYYGLFHSYDCKDSTKREKYQINSVFFLLVPVIVVPPLVLLRLLQCRIPNGFFVSVECRKRSELGGSLHHRHARMPFRCWMFQVYDILVFAIHNALRHFHHLSFPYLRFMPSDLLVTFLGGGSFLKVQTTQNGVLAESLLYRQPGFLQSPFLLEAVFLLSLVFG